MKQLLVPTLLILALAGVAVRDGTLRSQVEELAERPQTDPGLVVDLRQQVSELSETLAQARAASADEEREVEALTWRLRCLEDELGAAGLEVARYNTRLGIRLQELRGALEQRWDELDHLASSTAQVAEQDRQRIEQLDRSLVSLTERDMHRMWSDLVGPVVQIAGETTVGSGVLLESTRISGSDAWKTHVLTSWHVVRDIYSSPDRTDEPIPVKIYLVDGSTRAETATLLAYDPGLDMALLELDSTEPVPHGAHLPSRERLGEVQVFDSIYAVGCPLGNDPIPTAGEVASTNHRVDGSRYWMISAPTYIGNSGGGIFDARTHELLGIFSKIYTHGSLRSTIVPHMGLVTPMPAIYDWFESVGFLDLAASEVPEAGGPQEAAALTVRR